MINEKIVSISPCGFRFPTETEEEGIRNMSQAELANVGKFVLALFAYFIGTGVFGIIIAGIDSDDVPTVGWIIGGLAFATLILFV